MEIKIDKVLYNSWIHQKINYLQIVLVAYTKVIRERLFLAMMPRPQEDQIGWAPFHPLLWSVSATQ